jgi:hypothetical protein
MVAISAVPTGLLTRGDGTRATHGAGARTGAWARSRFTPFHGATFRMTGGAEKVDVVLAEIRDLNPVSRPADEKRFSLVFTAARDHPPVNGIRRFRNDRFGEIEMFVSPIGHSTESLRYQVIVNRL